MKYKLEICRCKIWKLLSNVCKWMLEIIFFPHFFQYFFYWMKSIYDPPYKLTTSFLKKKIHYRHVWLERERKRDERKSQEIVHFFRLEHKRNKWLWLRRKEIRVCISWFSQLNLKLKVIIKILCFKKKTIFIDSNL